MTSADALKATFKSDREFFLDTLSSFVLIDIGTIQEVDNEGKATVVSSAFIGDRPVVYNKAEVIYPGNANGSYASYCSGCTCLIFIPRSNMPDIKNQKLHLGSVPYNTDGVKAMPISNGTGNLVKCMFNSDGTFTLFTDTYSLQCGETDIMFERKDGSTSLNVDGTGQLYVRRKTENGILDIEVEDDAVKKSWTSSDGKVKWTDTYNPDGSRSMMQYDPDGEEGDDPLFGITITKEGELQFHNEVDVNLEIKGDANISVTGDAKIDAENIELNGNDKRLVTYAELKAAMDKLWIAMTTTPIAGNGSTQPSWTGITSIDISASETQTIKTGG